MRNWKNTLVKTAKKSKGKQAPTPRYIHNWKETLVKELNAERVINL